MASKKPHLRAAEEGEAPQELSVSDAAARGSRLEELIAMRRVIARHIDNEQTAARDLAALSRRQMELSKEIEAEKARVAREAEEASNVEHVSDEEWRPEAI